MIGRKVHRQHFLSKAQNHFFKCLTLLSCLGATQAQAATFTVNNTNDSGAGSLRQAITSANSTTGADTIAFNIAGTGVQTISVGSGGNGPLPVITDTVTIDGYTQPGAQPNTLAVGKNAVLLIVITASANESVEFSYGLESHVPNCVFRGLVINRFENHSIFISGSGATGNRIEGCYIGTNAAGTAAVMSPNGPLADAIRLEDGANNTIIGGTTPAARNVLSGNSDDGIWIGSDNNVVQGNYIGTNAAGTAAIANLYDGIFIAGGGSNNLIGGTTAGARNVISGNSGGGVCIEEAEANNNVVQGNYIGSNAAGTAGLGNFYGVEVMSGGDNSIIGGIGTGQANLIAYNTYIGVSISDEEGSGLTPPVGIAVRGNRIFNNGFIGIDLADPSGLGSVTPNDLNDLDTGPNNLQNFPVITSLTASGGATVANGTLNSRPNRSYALDFYANNSLNEGGQGEGENYIASTTVTTNASGNATFNVNLGGNFAGKYITATATQTTAGAGFNDTSEFSAAALAPQSAIFAFSSATYTVGEASGTATITVSRTGTTTTAATVDFATANGTAIAGSDYTATTGTLSFAANETTKTFIVTLSNDTLDENDETINLTLSNPTGGASIGSPATATLTITDDDTAPTLTVGNPRSTKEGSATTPGFTTFAVTLSAASGREVRVNYTTTNGVTNGAIAGSDYAAKSGTLTFAPGETVKYVRVNFIGDDVAEMNEPFFFDIRTPVNATIARSRGSVYIQNDDGPGITIDNAVTVNEGNSGTVPQDFVVRLSAASTNTITVDWTTANGTAGPADYTVANGRLTFAPGETSKTITVLVKGDTLVEPNETYRVNLSRATLAIIGDSQGVAYIRNDDSAPGVIGAS